MFLFVPFNCKTSSSFKFIKRCPLIRCWKQIKSIQSFKLCFISHSSTSTTDHKHGFFFINDEVGNEDGREECKLFDDVKLFVSWWELTGGVEISMIRDNYILSKIKW